MFEGILLELSQCHLVLVIFFVTNDNDVDYNGELIHHILLANCVPICFLRSHERKKNEKEAMGLEIEAIEKNKI